MDDEFHFEDPGSLVKCIKGVLWLQVAGALWLLWLDVREHQLLTDLKEHRFASRAAAMTAAQASDDALHLANKVMFAIFVLGGVLILRWIYRTNVNARALGARDLEYTPGWSVGWYFVPIMLLWKPYDALKELYRACRDPLQWTLQSETPLLMAWWLLWLGHGALEQCSTLPGLGDERVDELLWSNGLYLLANVSEIPLVLVFMALVDDMHRSLMRSASRPRPEPAPTAAAAAGEI